MPRVAIVLAFSLLTSHALGQERPREIGDAIDVWSEPNPGIRYLDRRTTTPCRVHAIVVQLDAPGIQIVATTHAQRWRTVSSFAEAAHVQVAINGGFWALMQGARGLAAGGGAIWPRNGELDPELGELVIDREHDVRLVAPGEPIDDEGMAAISDAVSGRPWLVHDGELVTETLDAFETANDRAPRTAAGLSRDGHLLYLAVVDGRQPESRGMTLYELGRLMDELGAYEAMNLDGGASSEMWVQELGGIVSVPSRGRWEIAVDDLLDGRTVRQGPNGTEVLTRGREQEVINHIGILAPAPPEVAVRPRAMDDALPAAPSMARPTPLPPRIAFGQRRETIAQAIAWGAPLALVTSVAWLVRRWRKRRASKNSRSTFAVDVRTPTRG